MQVKDKTMFQLKKALREASEKEKVRIIELKLRNNQLESLRVNLETKQK